MTRGESGGDSMRRSKRQCAILANLFLITSPIHAQTAPSDLQTAQQLLKSGHPDQSLALVEPIIAEAMQNAAKDSKAMCPGEAVAVLQTFAKGEFTVSVTNDWCDALLVKGYALNELKRPVEAEQILKTLVGHAPRNPQYLIEYAYTVRVNGDLERALGVYKHAGTITSNLPKNQTTNHWRAAALRGEGYVYTEMQRWDEAVKAYKSSLKYEPDSEIAHHEMQYIAERRGASASGS